MSKIFIVSIFSLTLLVGFAPMALNAQTELPRFSVPLFTEKLTQPKSDAQGNLVVTWIQDYIRYAYSFSLIAASVIAVVSIIAGGFIWITALGRAEKVESAKKL